MKWILKFLIVSCLGNHAIDLVAQSIVTRVPECSDCVVKLYGEKYSRQLYVGYDNIDKREYLSLKGPSKVYGTERVIFYLDSKGLNVYAFIPKVSINILYDVNTLHKKSKIFQYSSQIELYTRNSVVSFFPLKSKTGEKLIDSLYLNVMKNNTVSLTDSFEVQVVHSEYKSFSNRQIINFYRNYAKPKWYWEVGGTFGVSYRAIQVTNPMPDRSKYESRYDNDRAGFSWTGSIRGGLNVNANNSFYAGVNYLFQQLHTQGEVNWDSGLPIGGEEMSKNEFHYLGVELGYSVEDFKKRTSACLDLGMNFMKVMNDTNTDKFGFGPHFGLGVKTRLGTSTDLRIMPDVYFNLLSLEKKSASEELATRMFTAGVKIAIRKYQM